MAITKVTNSLVATNAIQGTLIADNAITSVHIAQNQVTAVQIPDGSITSTQIAANSIDTAELVTGSIDAIHLASDSVTTAKILDANITTAKIANNAITSALIPDGSITDTQLGSGAFTMGNITTTGSIRGPASLTIDPATVGDNTGTVVIAGNLQVDGTTTTVNSTTLDVADKNITLGKGGSASANNGGGITIDGAAATILYNHSDTSWQFNKPTQIVSSEFSITSGASYTTHLNYQNGGNNIISQANGGSTTIRNSAKDLFTLGSAGDVTIADGIFTTIHDITTVNKFKTTNNNTRSIISMESKDSSGNAVDLRLHALGDGPRGEIYTYTNHPLAFATNNAAPQMTLLTNGNFGIGTGSPDALLHVSATSPHIDIGPQGGNRGKIGYHSNDVIIGSTSSTGSIILKNNISSTDSPQTSGDTKVTIHDVGMTIHSDTYNILAVQTDSNNDQTSTDGIIKITNNNGSSDVTKAEFRWDESEDLVHVSYGDHGRHVSINSSGNVGINTGSTSPTATLDVAGTALVEKAKLKTIAASNSDTAVDVFVYDTRKDSDGGAWRKRTQHTSWYNETLNTSTRGARKEFPSVAVLVIASNNVIIYDGDDSDMPMWMVFPSTGSVSWATGGTSTLNSTVALNGIVVISSGANSGGGIGQYNFAKDDISISYSSTLYSLNDRKISTGRLAKSYSTVSSGGGYPLIDSVINDIAMTVLPNAPIDADTGLPVPTIAVATNGGVSVIKDDGSVVDITAVAGSSYNGVSWIDITENNYLIFEQDSSSRSVFHVPIPTTDRTSQTNDGSITDKVILKFYRNGAHIPYPCFNGEGIIDGIGLAGNNQALRGSNNELTLLEPNIEDPEQGKVAYIASDYNTGWMYGDVKVATLSDTDTTNVTATELITNGTTFSNTTGWSGNSATVSVSGGELVVTGTASTASNQSASFTYISCEVGDQFIVSFDITERTAVPSSSGIIIGNSKISANNDLHYWYPNAVGSYTTHVTAESTSISIQMHAGTGVGVITKFDNISMKKAEKDYSVNGKGVEVFGTVTKTAVATGAELVGYSGFSSSNYLRQPYNTNLNFGTGSYSVMGWFKTDATSSTGIITQLGPGDTDESLCVYISPSNYGIYFDYGVGNQYAYLSSANDRALIANTNWHHFVCHVSAGGSPKVYVDGVDKALTVSANAPSTFTFDTDYVLNIGNGRGTDNNLPFGGSIALLRISATVPTPEQIVKIYDDEKHLFATNAKATLYGSSDAVTALAYDDDTELLHAGTSAGRSVFQGLNRVNNTTDAVGAAISASNGFIAED